MVSPLLGPKEEKKKNSWLPPRHMAPEGPYRYRSFNMLPVECRRRSRWTEAHRDVRFRPEEGRREGGKQGNKRRFLDVEGGLVADGL